MRKPTSSSRWQGIFKALGFARRAESKGIHQTKRHALRLEPLEDRHLLSVLCWDPQQSGGSNLGGSGTWTSGGTATVWYNPDTQTDVVWNNANGDTAVFGGTAGTVTVASAVTASGIGLETAGYSLSGAAITLTTNNNSGWLDGEIRVTGAADAIDAVLAGSVGLSKTGAGTLTLTGENTYSGGTTLYDGALAVAQSDATFGTGAIHCEGGALAGGLGATVDNTIVVDQDTTLFVAGTLNLNGDITSSSDSVTLYCRHISYEDYSDNVLRLGGDNSGFLGTFDESEDWSGTMATYFTQESAGSAAAAWNIDGGVLANAIDPEVSATPTIALGSLSGSDGTLTNLVTGSTVTYQIGGNNASTEFDGAIQDDAGAVALAKDGSGTLTLTNANTYSGDTLVQNGTLALAGGDDRLPTGTTVTLGDEQDHSGVLQLGDGTTSYNQTLAGVSTSGDGTGNRVVGGGAGTATLTLVAASDDEYDGLLGGPGVDQNNLALAISGDGGIVAFTGNNTYAGGTYVNAGLVGTLGSDTAFGTGTIYLNGGAFGGTGTLANAIDVQDDTGIYPQPTLTLNGNISGSAQLTVNNLGSADVLQLGGDNSGFGGTFELWEHHNYYGYGSMTTEFLSPSAGSSHAAWQVDGGVLASNIDPNVYAAPSIALGSLSGDGTLTNLVAGSTVTYQIGGTNNRSTQFNGIVDDGGGTVALEKTAYGRLTLGGTNAYSGGTTISGGTLVARTPDMLLDYDVSGAVAVDSGGTLVLNVGGNGEWTAADVSTLLSHVTFQSGSVLGFDTSGGDFEYDSAIGGSLGIVKLGDHTLTFGGTNTYSGGTTLTQGSLAIGNAAEFGGGALTLAGGTLVSSGTITLSMAIAASDSTTSAIDVDGTLTLNGSISGAGRIDCTGSDANSVLNLGGDNSNFGGELDLGPGATYFTSASAGSSMAAWVLDGGVLANNVPLNVSAAPMIALGALSGSGTLSNMVADSIVIYEIGGANHSTQFDGAVEDGDGTVALAKTANGSLTLAGTNSYSGGTLVDGGTLAAQTPGSLPAYNSSGKVTVQSGATLALNVGGTGEWTVNDVSTLLSNGVFNGGWTLGLDTSDGNFEYDSAIGGNLSLAKLGTGTLVLTAANTYSGNTFVRNGTLELAGGDDRLPTSTVVTLGDAAADTSGVLQLGDGTTARNQTLAGLTNDMDYQYSAANDRVVGGGSGAATLTLHVAAGADYEFDGILGGTGTHQNNLILVKTGLGTEALGAVNTYSGGTTLGAGVLQVWNAEGRGTGSVTTNGGVLRNLGDYNTTGHYLYYVDPDGLGGTPDDGNDGSIHHPLATLTEACQLAQPGDTVILRGGTYNQMHQGGISTVRSGLPGLPITIEAAPGEHPVSDEAERTHWEQAGNGCWYTDLSSAHKVEIINGWAATDVSDPADFFTPDGRYYQNGQLAFDLTWYDAANERLWFRSNEIEPITDPDSQCGVVGYGQIGTCDVSWLVLRGLDIENGYFGIEISSSSQDDLVSHITIEDCRITHMWGQGILIGGTDVEISNNYVDAIGGQLTLTNGEMCRQPLYHDLYAVGTGFMVHDNFFGRALSGLSVTFDYLLPGNSAPSVFADNVCYGGQDAGMSVDGANIFVTGNVIISPKLIWRGTSPMSPYTSAFESGLIALRPQQCSNIVVSGNYIEGTTSLGYDYSGDQTSLSNPIVPGWVLTGNTIAGQYDINWSMFPQEMNGNQWGGESQFIVNLSPPIWTYSTLGYDAFLAWAQDHDYGSVSAGMPTSLIDPSAFDPQLDAGMSLAQAMALFRTYATGKVASFAGSLAVLQSSSVGGTATPNVNGNTPQAGIDTWNVTAGTTLTKDAENGVLANDSDADSYALTALLVSQPKYGQLTLSADGSLSYTPYSYVGSGTDTFTYLASDGHGGTALATVVINVVPPLP